MYELVRNDQQPQVQATITRQDDGSVVAFNGGSAKLKFRAKGATTLLFTLNALDTGQNFQDGIALFSFSGTQLDLAEGYYEGEIEILYATGKTESVFKVLDFYIRDDF
jgi:hypothetical protein|tara:strand:+ start:163 stop:486 length:324 start_codon:yes stop_codon:yes gene_type:complete